MAKDKTDPFLGVEVEDHLRQHGIETPRLSNYPMTESDQIEIASLFGQILSIVGANLDDDSLQDTPDRVADMYINEIFSGMDTNNFPKCTTVDDKFNRGEEFVLEKDIALFSQCEHHLMPIYGVAHVAYIPQGKVLGLSKMNRIVRYFARRPQVQERLSAQIAYTLAYVLNTPHAIAFIDAKHMCVTARGIEDTSSTTRTLCALGCFGERGSQLRQEFLANVG